MKALILSAGKNCFKDLFYTAGWPKSELQQLLKSIALTSLLSALPVIILSTLLLFWLLNKLLIKPILQLTLNARKNGQTKGTVDISADLQR